MNEEGQRFAQRVALEEALPYIDRNNQALIRLDKAIDVFYVWTAKGWFAETKLQTSHHFHPGTAMFRFKRWKQGEREPFLEATALKTGDQFLDCTLGLGSDCLMASLEVGEKGKVTGVEKSAISAFLFRNSQFHTDLGDPLLNEALQRIEFFEMDALDYLTQLPSDSMDVVYIDPMFEKRIEEATNFRTHQLIAKHDALSDIWVREALRVAKKRVVLKAHFRSEWFELYGFTRLARKTAKFHFGYIEKNKLSR